MRIWEYLKKLATLLIHERNTAIEMVKNSAYSRLLFFYDPEPKCRRICMNQHVYNKLKKEFWYLLDEKDSNKKIVEHSTVMRGVFS